MGCNVVGGVSGDVHEANEDEDGCTDVRLSLAVEIFPVVVGSFVIEASGVADFSIGFDVVASGVVVDAASDVEVNPEV